jgi:antitoxin HicB
VNTTFTYPARFTPGEDGRILVEFVDFPRAATDGKDMAEALAEATDCLGSVISFQMEDKGDIPTPSRPRRGEVAVPVPIYLAPKLALYLAMRERKISNSGLAKRLGIDEAVVRRMLDPAHKTKAEKIHAALEALGVYLVVTMKAA